MLLVNLFFKDFSTKYENFMKSTLSLTRVTQISTSRTAPKQKAKLLSASTGLSHRSSDVTFAERVVPVADGVGAEEGTRHGGRRGCNTTVYEYTNTNLFISGKNPYTIGTYISTSKQPIKDQIC